MCYPWTRSKGSVFKPIIEPEEDIVQGEVVAIVGTDDEYVQEREYVDI